jgi:hypothetical protein
LIGIAVLDKDLIRPAERDQSIKKIQILKGKSFGDFI